MLSLSLNPANASMSAKDMYAQDQGFYARLGQRIAEQRRAQGLTQVELAKALGVVQQTLAHYEGGTTRIPIASLLRVAETLGTSVEELAGTATKPGKRGPAPKLQQQLERLSRLPRAEQRAASKMLDGLLKQAS